MAFFPSLSRSQTQNTLTPASATKAPSVDAVVQALLGKQASLPTSPGGTGAFLRSDYTWAVPPGGDGGGGGDLLAANNLSDVANAATARGNLGAAASSHTHGAAAISDSSAAGRALLTAADVPAQMALLNNFSYTVKGLVPAPGGSGTSRFLREDGSWQNVSAGSATWGGITGTLSAQTDVQAALDAKASILAPVTLSENTSLTAAAHGNRQILVGTAGLTLTINNDATGGWTADDALDIQAIGSGTFTLVQGTATLTTDSGASADSTTAVGKRVQAQRTGASAWRTISPVIVTGVGSSNVGNYSVPADAVAPAALGILTTQTLNVPLSALATGAVIEVWTMLDFGAGTAAATFNWRLGGTESSAQYAGGAGVRSFTFMRRFFVQLVIGSNVTLMATPGTWGPEQTSDTAVQAFTVSAASGLAILLVGNRDTTAGTITARGVYCVVTKP